MSAGAFLKSELHRGSTESDDSIKLSKLNTQGERLSPPKIPERRLSKSKTFFFNFKGRKDKESKPPPRNPSVTSNNTLIRRFSRSSKKNSIPETAYTKRITLTDSSYSLDRGQDIADVVLGLRNSSCHRDSLHSWTSESSRMGSESLPENLVLCPEMKITPEVMSLDGASANLWVAVEITGVLRPANTAHDSGPTIFRDAQDHCRDSQSKMPLFQVSYLGATADSSFSSI
jgi:hypothetical protein